MTFLRPFGFLILLLLQLPLAAQPVNSGNEKYLADAPEAVEAAQRTGGGARVAQFQRALAWYGRDSFARCRMLVDSLAHNTQGGLIVDSLSGLAYHLAGMSYYQVYDDASAVPQYLRHPYP